MPLGIVPYPPQTTMPLSFTSSSKMSWQKAMRIWLDVIKHGKCHNPARSHFVKKVGN
jgi:hypothetical protein